MNVPALVGKLPPWLKQALVGKRPKRTLIRASILILASFVIFKFILIPIRIEGISMTPNYRDGSINFVNKLAYRGSTPQRGDVVAVRMAGESVMLMKRIVGLPGERFAIRHGNVYINGREIEESYVKSRINRSWWQPEILLDTDTYWIMGDNRSMPADSHYKGTAPRERIVGKVLF
jgi:signal peptidase I